MTASLMLQIVGWVAYLIVMTVIMIGVVSGHPHLILCVFYGVPLVLWAGAVVVAGKS